jgi:hypothetical protein
MNANTPEAQEISSTSFIRIRDHVNDEAVLRLKEQLGTYAGLIPFALQKGFGGLLAVHFQSGEPASRSLFAQHLQKGEQIQEYRNQPVEEGKVRGDIADAQILISVRTAPEHQLAAFAAIEQLPSIAVLRAAANALPYSILIFFAENIDTQKPYQAWNAINALPQTHSTSLQKLR